MYFLVRQCLGDNLGANPGRIAHRYRNHRQRCLLLVFRAIHELILIFFRNRSRQRPCATFAVRKTSAPKPACGAETAEAPDKIIGQNQPILHSACPPDLAKRWAHQAVRKGTITAVMTTDAVINTVAVLAALA